MWPLRLWRLLKSAGRDGLLLAFALRDPETPRAVKAGIVALALYLVSPIDLVPDVLAVFGWADDVALLMVGVPWLVRRLPPGVRARAALRAGQFAGRFGARRA
jgi:uncharacterized membrane protein YkvA (DUF1232 family)